MPSILLVIDIQSLAVIVTSSLMLPPLILMLLIPMPGSSGGMSLGSLAAHFGVASGTGTQCVSVLDHLGGSCLLHHDERESGECALGGSASLLRTEGTVVHWGC